MLISRTLCTCFNNLDLQKTQQFKLCKCNSKHCILTLSFCVPTSTFIHILILLDLITLIRLYAHHIFYAFLHIHIRHSIIFHILTFKSFALYILHSAHYCNNTRSDICRSICELQCIYPLTLNTFS